MLCIKGGRLVTPAGIYERDLWIEGEKIVSGENAGGRIEVYDASGCLVFPGFIDAHTHFEMVSGVTVTADDFPSGTAAALAGGTTCILDFATQDRGGTLSGALDRWFRLAEGRSCCDFGFHMAVTDWSPSARKELADMASRGVTSFKAYMAYDALRLTDEQLLELLASARELGCITGVHCELGEEVNRRVRAELSAGHTQVKYHPLSRPNEVEGGAIRRLMELALESGAPVWVVHLSTREGMEEIRAAREKGVKVLVETCPQYLTLTEEVYIKPGFEGAKYVCSPPIRSAKDKDELWSAIMGGEVDIISTDHCSYNFRGQKELGREDFSKIPNGLPGVEHRPALIWTYGVRRGKITPEGMAALLSENPARAFGMYPRKGAMEPGSDADVVVWDPDFRGKLTAKEQLQKADYSPWEGLELEGRAKAVFLRGELCAENGKIIKRPWGRYVSRRAAW
ncbi:MAG: dihydropyrimidinase [Oscillospiraceae bacterium]